MSMVMAYKEAQERIGRIRAWVNLMPVEDIKACYQGKAWEALGYDSWMELCDCELDGFKLPAVERRELVVELASGDDRLSNRAIADVVGVSHPTVAKDLATGKKLPVGPKPQVQGKDGRRRSSPSKPARPSRDPPRPGVTRFSTAIQSISASISENSETLTDEEVAEALGAAQFLYELLRGEVILRKRAV